MGIVYPEEALKRARRNNIAYMNSLRRREKQARAECEAKGHPGQELRYTLDTEGGSGIAIDGDEGYYCATCGRWLS